MLKRSGFLLHVSRAEEPFLDLSLPKGKREKTIYKDCIRLLPHSSGVPGSALSLGYCMSGVFSGFLTPIINMYVGGFYRWGC